MCVRFEKPHRVHISALRENYISSEFTDDQVDADPFAQFQTWFYDAIASAVKEPNAMCLSTTGNNGKPSSRMVLLKGFDKDGFVWYTNYESHKVHQLSESSSCFTVLLGYFESSGTCSAKNIHFIYIVHAFTIIPSTSKALLLVLAWVRVEGPVQKVPDEESEQHFHSQPRGSQIRAIVSKQVPYLFSPFLYTSPMGCFNSIRLKTSHLCMDSILEKYERYSFAERQLLPDEPQSPANWTLEYSKLKARIELLQRNHRHYMGEELENMSTRDLQNLEQQLDTALKNIRTRKNQVLHETIVEMQKKEKAIQEQNRMLEKKIKERVKEMESQQQQQQQNEAQWDEQNHCTNAPTMAPLPFLMPNHIPTLNMNGGDGAYGEVARRNDLDLALDSLYSPHMGCFT